jgi:formamidopyrimidine-DNA glycosylase
LVLELESGAALTFRDVRKFGKVEWLAPGAASARLDKLGPDALTLTRATLAAGLRERRAPIKTALLDQRLVAGIGNIYADEALFAAGVAPTRPAGSLSPAELAALTDAIRRILRTSVRRGGSTINDYLRPDGELGGYQDWHQVYGRTGEPCPRCQAPLARLVLGARSSHYCPRCQR